MSSRVLSFEPGEPCLYLGLAESQVASDPKPGGASALAAQVVDRLGTDVQFLGELLHRQCRLEDAGDDDGILERGGSCDW